MISCKCITYGRVSFLEEAIESFLKQDYAGEKELVIVNDYPLQKLGYDHPEVKIFNLDYTFDTIGEKENFAVSKCSGEIIALWDDDDIALPNHLSNVKKYIEGYDWLQWSRNINCVEFEIAAISSTGVSGMAYRKSSWEKVNYHALENAGYDITFIYKMQAAGLSCNYVSLNDEELSWIYMWGNGTYHMSGMGTDTPDRPNVVVRHQQHIESLRQANQIPIGEIALKPYWRKDYSKMLKDYLSKQ